MFVRYRLYTALLASSLALFFPVAASAATITIINLDSAGVGLNDTTPATPVGGNTGTTKGAQALQTFELAASIWAGLLDSSVEIKVGASFAALSCTAFSGTLGSAGPETVHQDFLNAPLPSTWYVQGLANSLAGSDLDPSNNDIGMQFNGAMGTTGCLESLSWYMGLDEVEPANTINLASVALHEIGHGLGFLSLVSLSTGAKFNSVDDAYSNLLENHSTGTLYPAMTNAQRVAASTDTGDLHWTGAASVAASGSLSSGVHASGHVEIYAPSPQESGSSVSHWSTAAFPDELMEPSHTGPDLDPGLALELMADLGWQLLSGCSGGVPDGTACDDGLFCNGADTCSGGACSSHAGDPCSGGGECSATCNEVANNCFDIANTPCTEDAIECTADVCDGAGACSHTDASAQAGGCGDDGTYRCDDSNDPGGPSSFVYDDIAASGSSLALADDASSGAALGFTFNFYGSDYTSLNVCSNGLFSFTSTACPFAAASIPNAAAPNAAIMAFWEDLDPTLGGTIHYETLGAAPQRRFVVQFTNIQHFGGGSPISFQLVLFESANHIEVRYLSATPDGGTHTIGIENATGTDGIQVVNGNPGTLANFTIRYDTGVACDDGSVCTFHDICVSSVCSGSNLVTCTASDQCHDVGTCDPGTGVCSDPAVGDGAACNDGDACTQTDTCQAGVCTGSNPVTCTASDQCHTVGSCDTGTGICSDPSVGNGTSCDDSDACTQTDSCQAGTCTGTNPVVCSASDQCHAVGTCDPGNGVCSAPNATNGTVCEDGVFCNSGETCTAGACGGGGARDCSGAGDQCNTGSCNEGSNACEAVVANEGNACDDGDPATTGDQCSAGVCSGTIPPPPAVVSISLPAGDPVPGQIITGELLIETSVPLGNYGIDINCDAALLAIVPPVSGGNTTEFTAAPVQNLGACSATLSGFQFSSLTSPTGVVSVAHVQFEVLAGAVAGSSSTVDLVPSLIGDADGNSLAFVALDNTITIASVCGNGLLEVGEQCDDSNTDAGDCCSATCTFEPGSCDDGAFCTTGETCTAGVCGGGGLTDCSGAGDQCHSGSCNESSNACEAVVANEGNACDDGAFCTTGETCTAGACGGGGGRDCSGAGDQCHSGSCNESSNACEAVVANEGNACDDGAFCTTGETCTAGACGGGGGRDCSGAGTQCNTGSCNENSNACEAVAANEGASCDDGNVATTSDVCTGGVCSGVDLCAAVTCTASDQCHDSGVCNQATGICSDPAADNGTVCDDGDPATTSDVCTGGVCSGVDLCAAVTCTASDQCHDVGSCDQGTGVCSNPAASNGSGCDDGDPATTSDVCTGGVCSGLDLCAAVSCTASDQCHTVGTCDPNTGLCGDPIAGNGTVCDDGDAATTSDVCTGGVCSGVDLCAAVTCTASDQCHDAGTCDATTGACNDPASSNGTACDDGDPVTTGDECVGGVCGGTDLCAAVTCTASDQCHVAGTCDPGTGACSDPIAGNGTLCDDGDLATTSDVCTGGVCSGVDLCAAVTCTASDQCHDVGICASSTGVCNDPASANATVCDDGDPATTSDVCTGGVCSGLDLCAAVTCTASDQCHDAGTCAPLTGACSDPASANGTACDDGDLCSDPDFCSSGVCEGLVTDCSGLDGNCVLGSCDVANGNCAAEALADGGGCDDGDLCTESDQCSSGACVGAAGALFESTSMKLGLRGAGEDKLSLKSQAALADMLGLPTSGGVELVLSDSLGNPVYFASIAAGDWEDVRDQGSKFKFKDRTGTLADGILKALLKVNTRRGIVLLKAKGKNLDLQAATGEASLWLSVVVGGSLSGSCTSAPAMVCTTRGRNLKCEL
jgi:hypothetical protein